VAPTRLIAAELDAQDRPNVLLITVDDMGWDTPGCFGGTVEDITPNIDRLAAEGCALKTATSMSPSASPPGSR
jgi:arylsulfatase A-like enzyme